MQLSERERGPALLSHGGGRLSLFILTNHFLKKRVKRSSHQWEPQTLHTDHQMRFGRRIIAYAVLNI